MREPIGVGIVGAGGIAPVHVEAVAALEWTRLVGVTDLDGTRAAALAAHYRGVDVLPSLEALVDAGARVIHVLTPPAAHAAVARAALERGCDVLVEKPLAASLADAVTLRDLAAARGRRLVPCHSLLADPQVARVLAAVEAGRLGTVLDAEYLCTAEYPPWEGGPVPPPYRDGGFPFRDLGVHGLYLLRALLGEIEGMDVARRRAGGDPNLAFDEWDVLVRCARGTGRIRLSWTARPLVTQLTVRGTQGTLRADVGAGVVSRRRPWPLPSAIARGLEVMEEGGGAVARLPARVLAVASGRLRPYPGLRAFVRAAHLAFAGEAGPPATADDGVAVVRWVEEAAAPADADAIARRARFAPRPGATVAVTGAAGLLGRHVVRRLAHDGEQVRAVVRREPAADVLPDGVEVVLADLGDADAVDAALTGVRGVVHCGAAMHGGAAEHRRATIAGTGHVVDACRRHGVARLVHVSSLSVLDWAALDGGHVDEAAPLEPRPEARGRYTQAKLAAEHVVADAARHGLPAVIVRPGVILGPERLAPATAGGIVVGGTMLLPGDGGAPMPLVDVEDAADAVVRALRADVAPGTVVHVVDDRIVSQRMLARRAATSHGLRLRIVPAAVVWCGALAAEIAGRLLGIAPPLTRAAFRATRARCTFDSGLARRLLGWQPAGEPVSRACAADRASACVAARRGPAADTGGTSPGPAVAPEAAVP